MLFVLSTCIDCHKYGMICTVLSTSFLLLWGIDLTVTSHILPVFEKRKNGGYALHYMSYS